MKNIFGGFRASSGGGSGLGAVFRPLIVVPAVVVIALVVLLIVIFAGGGGDDDGGGDAASGIGEGDPTKLPGAESRNPKPAPVVRTGLVDEARRVGRLAVAQARGRIIEPTRVRVRVSAAPKQAVTVNWQLGCYRDRRAKVGRGQYRVKPYDIREIELPMSGAEMCIVTAGAQLTDPDSEGRIKVGVIAG